MYNFLYMVYSFWVTHEEKGTKLKFSWSVFDFQSFFWLWKALGGKQQSNEGFISLKGRVHQFSSHMHEFFSHKLTGIFLSTLDHGFITSGRIFRPTLWFIRYTTKFVWILEIYFSFHATLIRCCLHFGSKILPPLLARKWRIHFAIGCTITS